MKYYIILLGLSFCFGCSQTVSRNQSLDSTLAMARETKLMLDTQLMVAKFNSLEINAIAGMIRHRGNNRDSFFYYVGMADAFTEGRKTIYK